MRSSEQAARLLEKIRKYNEEENLATATEVLADNDPRLVSASMELAERTKSILAGLYFDFRKPNSNFIRRVRNIILDKIARIVRSTVERALLSQQKYNEQTYYLLKLLLNENARLKAEMEEMKSLIYKSNNS